MRLAFRINIDFDCFGAGVCCAFVSIDKLNANTNIYVCLFICLEFIR
jgi:hypothetical protein